MKVKTVLEIQSRCYFLYHKKNKIIFERFELKFKSFFLKKYLEFFYSAYIPIRAKLGTNLRFNHSFYNVFISEHCVIGDNCTILQNTTIGSNQPLSDDAPIVGNNVYIGCGCNIIGKVSIGDNCIIGAGTTIAKGNIQEGMVVVGSKYRVFKKEVL